MTKIQEQDFTLKTFQLRAARVVAGIELKEIGNVLGLTKAAISLWEHKDDFAPLTTSQENILILKEIFARHNIFFPDENSISLNEIIEYRKPEGLTRFQLKASRAILNISQEMLAQSINILKDVIARAELLKNHEYIRPLNKKLPSTLKLWFENKNIIFNDNLTVLFFRDKKIS